MRLRLVTAPAVTPVDVAAARAHVEVYGSAHDDKLEAMIDAAVSNLDGPAGILGRALVEQEWEMSLDAFPADCLDVPLPPLRSVSSITYIDAAGAPQTLAPAAYVVDTASAPGAITPAYGTSWPATRAQRNAVKVQFKAGYGATGDDVPAAIKQAILLMVGDLFENREAAVVGAARTDNPTVDRLLFPFRIVRP